MTQVLLCFMLSQFPLKLSSCFYFFAFYHLCVIFYIFCPNHISNPLHHLTYLLFFTLYSWCHYSFLTGYFSCFLSFFILSSLSIFITITLKSIYNNLLACILFSSFLEIIPLLSVGTGFFAYPFWPMNLCICFYVSDRSSLTPSFHGVALYSRYSLELNDAVSLIF